MWRMDGIASQELFKMQTTGTSCILYAHLHWVTSYFMMMSTDAYTMMIIITPCMIFNDLLYLQTSSYSPLVRLWLAQGVCEPPRLDDYMFLHSLTPVVGSLTEYFLKYSSRVLFLHVWLTTTPQLKTMTHV